MTDPMKTLDIGRPKPVPISKKVYAIAGITVTVFGLEELRSGVSVACLWLLHPRLATQDRMTDIASSTINDWNTKNKDNLSAKGLIAVSFDQRNHGSRMVDPLANEAWRQGNPRHAQDMFSIYQGTARDTSLLMDYLATYVFPHGGHEISQNMVLGVSLGGHAAWSLLLHEPRMSAGIIIIGAPDFLNVMVDRARLSKLPSWTKTSPPGSEILGSDAFPTSFLETVTLYDPAALFLSYVEGASGLLRSDTLPEPTEKEKQAIRPLLTKCLSGKQILNLSGGKDKLVPYHRGEAFLKWLKKAVSSDGWFGDGGVLFEDIIDESAGHEVTPKMEAEAVRFVSEILALEASADSKRRRGSVRESKI